MPCSRKGNKTWLQTFAPLHNLLARGWGNRTEHRKCSVHDVIHHRRGGTREGTRKQPPTHVTRPHRERTRKEADQGSRTGGVRGQSCRQSAAQPEGGVRSEGSEMGRGAMNVTGGVSQATCSQANSLRQQCMDARRRGVELLDHGRVHVGASKEKL